jgi:hypothetical protein
LPESKGRAKPARTSPAQRRPKTTKANAPWFVPLMLSLMVVGLLWVVTFYITAGGYPIPKINYWNLIIGFSLMISGFMMTTRWR